MTTQVLNETIQINTKTLKDNISKVVAISAVKSMMPVFGTVLLNFTPGHLELKTTNMELTASVTIPVESQVTAGVAIPAKFLSDVLAALPTGQVSLQIDESKAVLTITTGKSTSVLQGFPASDFPDSPHEDNSNILGIINSKALIKVLEDVSYATSPDSNRPVLTGVLWAQEIGLNHLTCAAADGFRLQVSTTSYESRDTADYIIPKTTVPHISKLFTDSTEDVTIEIRGNRILFYTSSTSLTSHLIQGTFPDYRRIIPTTFNTTIKVDRKGLILSTKLAATFALEVANNVKLTFTEGLVRVEANDNTIGDSHTEHPAEVIGINNSIAVNSKYLLDALSHASTETVELMVIDSTKPLLLSDGTKEAVIMPLSLAQVVPNVKG